MRLFLLLVLAGQVVIGQNEFINIKHNKVLCTLSFLDTAANAPGSPPSFVQLIQNAYSEDPQFKQLITDYKSLNIYDEIKRERFPKKRHASTSVQDLMWVASANATSIKDFAERTIGILIPSEHRLLITTLTAIAPYYDNLIWQQTETDRQRMEKDLSVYRSQVSEMFQQVKHFLGSSWNEETPFNIMLYPIPLKSGGTTAIPKGNNLICSYLSKREDEAKDIVGIALHEMNHILYSAQTLKMQEDIDKWFMESESVYARLAYDFFDEGLATAVGNGWAYEKINGKLDTNDWYNVTYINDFGKALYPMVKDYITQKRIIDKNFIDKSITLFGEAFPDAPTDLGILMNNINLFAQTEAREDIDFYFESVYTTFPLRSANFSGIDNDPETLTYLTEETRTKVLILHRDSQKQFEILKTAYSSFPEVEKIGKSYTTSFYDEKTQSPVLLFILTERNDFKGLLLKMKEGKLLKLGEILHLP